MVITEDIWENWKQGNGPCDGCPGRCTPHPLYGTGDEDTDFVIAALEPTYKLDPDHVTGQADELSWSQAKTLLYSDRVDSTFPLWDLHRELSDYFGIEIRDIYFTNVNKCNPVATDDADDREESLQHCRQYAKSELTHVNPKVCTVWGKRAMQIVFEEFGKKPPDSINAVSGECYDFGSMKVVPFPHWGYTMRYGNMSISTFWEFACQKVEEALDEYGEKPRITDY